MISSLTPPDPSDSLKAEDAKKAFMAKVAARLLAEDFEGCPCTRCEKCRLVLSYCQ